MVVMKLMHKAKHLINVLKCNQMKITFILLCFRKGLHNRDLLNKNEGEIIFLKSMFYKFIILEVGYIIVQSSFLRVKKQTFILKGSSELRRAVMCIWSIWAAANHTRRRRQVVVKSFPCQCIWLVFSNKMMKGLLIVCPQIETAGAVKHYERRQRAYLSM